VVEEVAPPVLDTLKTAVSDAEHDDAERAKAESELQLLTKLYTQACELLSVGYGAACAGIPGGAWTTASYSAQPDAWHCSRAVSAEWSDRPSWRH
jgi:hypothetical protein